MAVQTEAILAVSFGTSHNDTRERTIDRIEAKLQESYPERRIYRAWTSDMIRKKLEKRDDVHIDSVQEAFARMKKDGIRTVTVQPTHVMNAIENDKMCEQVHLAEADFEEIKTGDALFVTEQDKEEIVKILGEYWNSVPEDELIIFMGHGTSHEANVVYEQLDEAMKAAGHKNMYVGTVESLPTLEMIMKKIDGRDVKKVHLAPFMIVAGDHAKNDMAGDEEDSWGGQLKRAGYDVECHIIGLGELEGIQNMFVRHVREAK